MIRSCRGLSAALGAAILGWQVVNAIQGRFVHDFLVPDLIVAAVLLAAAVVKSDRAAAIGMRIAFLATAGVFAVATWRAILRDDYSPGRLLAGLGIVPCVVGLVMLAGSNAD